MGANNIHIIIGRVGQDPESKDVGKGLTTFSVAVQGYKDETNWFLVEMWGKQAELAMNLIKKGTLVSISGEGKIDKWEKDGEKREKYKIVGRDFRLLSGKKDYEEKPIITEDFSVDDDEPPPF